MSGASTSILLPALLAISVARADANPSIDEYFEYVSPRPDAQLVSRESNLIFRPRASAETLAWSANLKIAGARSGSHTGNWLLSSDSETLIFRPRERFAPGELVTVSFGSDRAAPAPYAFRISSRAPPAGSDPFDRGSLERLTLHREPRPRAPMTRPVPRDGSLCLPADFPTITVNYRDDPTPGSLLLTSFVLGAENGPYYLMILDNEGRPEFFRKMPRRVWDFKKQPNGLLTYFQSGRWRSYAMDHTYAVVDSFAAGNGYVADVHELRVLPSGHALLLIYDREFVNMSEIVEGGNPNALVIGLVVQELDAEGNVVFQWRSWDHFRITDATHLDLTQGRIDYVHGNAIESDHDGNLLISCRYLDEITKIDRRSGEIIWRLGGKNNEFTLIGDDTWFSRQHGVRRLDNGHVILYDNGTFNDPQESRAVEYDLDEATRVATKVWEYRNDPSTYGGSMGFAQRLPNENTLIAWGSATPTATEVRPDGSKAFELTLEDSHWSYRAFRHEWEGVAAVPYLWADTTGRPITLHFEKFGDRNVRHFYVYRGTTPLPSTRVDSTANRRAAVHGFLKNVPLHFRVTAVDDQMNESPFSNEIVITPSFSAPSGENDSDPPDTVLMQSSPNPFALSTTISWEVPRGSSVQLSVHNALGQRIRRLVSKPRTDGPGSIAWNGSNDRGERVSSGVYFYRLETKGMSASRRLVLVR